MTFFPQLSEKFYSEQTDGDRSIKMQMEQNYTDHIMLNQSFWLEADTDTRYKANDQSVWKEMYGTPYSLKGRDLSFNRIRRVCSMVTGYQSRNRNSLLAIPIENSDTVTAGQLSKVLLWSMEKENTLQTISHAFDGAVTTGMNMLSIWMDYRNDPISGDIRVDNCSYNSFLMDSFFKKHDLSDCNFVWTRKWLTKMQVKSLLPDRHSDIDSLAAHGSRDGKFQFMPEAYSNNIKDLLSYDEYWYRSFRDQKLLVDIVTGETMEWSGNDDDLALFKSKFPQITVIDNQIQTTKLAIVVQGTVLYNGANPMGIDKMPFVPVLCYYEPQIPDFSLRIQGMVRGLRDAQFLYNHRKKIELKILESQITSGYKYKADSLVNPKDVFLSGEGRGLAIKRDAQMTDVEKIAPPFIPPSMLEISKIIAEEIQQISGVNEELLGSAKDDKAGVLSMLRQGAGLTTLQNIFDNLDFSQKYLGRLYLDLIQANFSPGKIKRIINEEPSQQFFSKAFGKYDISIEEGSNLNNKQMQFQQLLALRELGLPIPSSVILAASTIQNKKELMESIESEEKQKAQSEQAAMKASIESQKAIIKDLEARAHANTGLGLERASRVQENRALAVEKLAEAEKDRDLGALSRIKAMKELEDMDIGQIEKLLTISEYIREKESGRAIQEEQQVTKPNIEELAVMAEGEKNEEQGNDIRGQGSTVQPTEGS